MPACNNWQVREDGLSASGFISVLSQISVNEDQALGSVTQCHFLWCLLFQVDARCSDDRVFLNLLAVKELRIDDRGDENRGR